jgi:hypothetical protein
MKIGKFLMVGVIALGLMACNNEDEIDLQGQPESTVSVKVVPSSNGPVVRATGILSGNGVLAAGLPAESVIKTLEVYLFYGEKPEGYGEATGDNVTEVKEIATHAGPKTIVVVANSNIGPVTTKTALMEATMNLPVAIASGLPMNGESAEIILEPGLNQYGYPENTGATQFSVGTPLPLYRVNARVAIVSADLADNLTSDQTDFFDDLTEVEVAMFNVPETTMLFGSPLAMNENFLLGEAWPTTEGTYTDGTVKGSFKDDVTFPITAADAPYYYVNENSSTVAKEKMMIVLRAKPTKNGVLVEAKNLYTDANGYTYYPIWVNAGGLGYEFTGDNSGDNIIRRNTQYNISLVIHKIGYPTIDPPAAATVDVKVSVEPWSVVTQNVVWGGTVAP